MLLPYILAVVAILYTLWFLYCRRDMIAGRRAQIALDSTRFQSFQLTERIPVSHDTCIFRFALQSPHHVLGLPIGQHISIRGNTTNTEGKKELVQHSYTPISSNEDVGHVDFLIKIYHKNVHPQFPNGGRLSQYLYYIPLGSMVEMRGPAGKLEYLGNGDYIIKDPRNEKQDGKHHADVLTMVAGGTGITPLLQVIRAIMRSPQDHTRIYLVYANHTEADILLREELDACAKDPRMQVWYTLSGAIPPGWAYSTGYVTEAMLRDHVPVLNSNQQQAGGEEGRRNGAAENKHVLALMCGPPMMLRQAVKPGLAKLGYTAENMFEF